MWVNNRWGHDSRHQDITICTRLNASAAFVIEVVSTSKTARRDSSVVENGLTLRMLSQPSTAEPERFEGLNTDEVQLRELSHTPARSCRGQ